MTDLRVARWKRRYRLPGNAPDERTRLDRLLSSAIDASLFDAALERAGFTSSDEICVRSVESFVRLDRSESDRRLSVTLSVALADAIAARLREGGPDVIRFRSRRHALTDLACRATRGDLAHAWAWRQLGIWRSGDFLSSDAVHREVMDVLIREADAAPAILAAGAHAGILEVLAVRAPTDRWIELARAALRAIRADTALIATLRWRPNVDEQAIAADALSEPLTAAQNAAVARLWERSTILRAIRGLAHLDPEIAQALSVLGLIESEPDLTSRPAASAIMRRIAAHVKDHTAPPPSAQERRDRDAAEPTRRPSDPSGGRARGTTAHGGLLFLLHSVRALELPTTIAGHPSFAARSLRWTLHGLAQLLAPVSEADPAALAFAGLAPGTRPPSHGEPPTSEDERVALNDFMSAICGSLREYGFGLPDDADRELLARVTTRRAEIIADPAWIDIRFGIGDATTDVRRLGLDLDLGWVPWLGVVLRFAYE